MYGNTGFVQIDFPTVLSFGQPGNEKEISACKFFFVILTVEIIAIMTSTNE